MHVPWTGTVTPGAEPTNDALTLPTRYLLCTYSFHFTGTVTEGAERDREGTKHDHRQGPGEGG